MTTFNPDGTKDDNPHGYIFAERGSAQWTAAWEALITAGHNPEEYMLMHGTIETDKHDCLKPDEETIFPPEKSIVWGFKHIDTRKYTYVIA